MNSPQYYKKPYKTSKEFLQWIYSHPLVSTELERDIQDMLWKDKPDVQEFYFGGKYGTQFQSVEEIKSFEAEFNKLLQEQNIDEKHKADLLYCIIFLNEDFEAQSLRNNLHNRLLDYARFILDVIATSMEHFVQMRKNEEYMTIFDEETQAFIFARKYLLETLTQEDIVCTIPETKKPDDILRYQTFLVYDHVLYLSPNLKFTMASDLKCKSFDGKKIDEIAIPPSFMSYLFDFTFKSMLEDHKRHDTPFYKMLKNPNLDLKDLKKIYSTYKKRLISQEQSLMKVALIIKDYFQNNNLLPKKVQFAQFLFKYFALMKAYPKKLKEPLPDLYEDLYTFYKKKGINVESIRMMMKDSEKLRGILV